MRNIKFYVEVLDDGQRFRIVKLNEKFDSLTLTKQACNNLSKILKDIIMENNYKPAIEFLQDQLDTANRSVSVAEKMLKEARELQGSLQVSVNALLSVSAEGTKDEVKTRLSNFLDAQRKTMAAIMEKLITRLSHDLELTSDQVELLAVQIETLKKEMQLKLNRVGDGK